MIGRKVDDCLGVKLIEIAYVSNSWVENMVIIVVGWIALIIRVRGCVKSKNIMLHYTGDVKHGSLSLLLLNSLVDTTREWLLCI